jgi:dTDP-4-dehydrorhamnose 3,5-epimerase
MSEPRLIKGGIAVDDRGIVTFVNDFDLAGTRRCYTIRNHRKGYVRAWHGHKVEAKYFTVVRGAMLICGVRIDNWEHPSKDLPVHRFVLSEQSPAVLHFPAGFANGMMSLTDDAQLLVFSTTTLQESLNDDFRFHARHWDPWSVEER